MPSERQLNVSLSMKIKGESTSVKVLPWDPFATFNVAVLIHYFVHIVSGVLFRKQANGLSSSHFRFRFQSVYTYQPCSLRSQLG
jgi:thiamine transporter ThiT